MELPFSLDGLPFGSDIMRKVHPTNVVTSRSGDNSSMISIILLPDWTTTKHTLKYFIILHLINNQLKKSTLNCGVGISSSEGIASGLHPHLLVPWTKFDQHMLMPVRHQVIIIFNHSLSLKLFEAVQIETIVDFEAQMAHFAVCSGKCNSLVFGLEGGLDASLS